MVSAQDVVDLYKRLSTHGIRIWLTGGWGIDALLVRELMQVYLANGTGEFVDFSSPGAALLTGMQRMPPIRSSWRRNPTARQVLIAASPCPNVN